MKLLFLYFFLPLASYGQGTFHFEWHGNSNFFGASFDVTAAEMQPGASWNSSLFVNSLTVTNPLGIVYRGGDSSSVGGGGVYPDGTFWLGYTFADFNRGTELHEGASNGRGTISEQPMGGPISTFENGFWTYSEIPEPSIVSLGGIGMAVLLLKKRERQL